MLLPLSLLQVIRGYLGDREAKSVFNSPTPFDILGLGYQRPFELATLRLFNMVNVLSKCECVWVWVCVCAYAFECACSHTCALNRMGWLLLSRI